MDYPPEDDESVIWQCSQAVALKSIFRDAPVATAPPPSAPAPGSSTRAGAGAGPHGVKRKRRHDQDTPATSSAETLGLIKQLSRTLGSSCSSNTNPARRNTRVASAGNITFGMPPPKMRPLGSDEASTSDPGSFNWSRSSTTSPLVISQSIPEFSSDSNHMATPSTPPNRTLPGPRSATEPTIPVSMLLDRACAESPEPPPPAPVKPAISIRTDTDTINRSSFSARSNTLESATSATESGSFVSATAPISPLTPLAALSTHPETPETPILDLTEISPTPSPEPKPSRKASPRSKSPLIESRASRAPTEAPHPPPTPSVARATTNPNPPKRPPVLSSQHAKSEPSRTFKSPTQSFKPPTQAAFKPPTQTTSRPRPIIHPTQQYQNPRTFTSSQSRLGLGTMGKGYSGVNKPFKVPNKGKGTVPLTVVPLPKRDGGTVKMSASPSKKKENLDLGRGKRGNSPAPAARPSTTRPTSSLSSRTTSGSSTRTSASTRNSSTRTTAGKHTQSRSTSGSKREGGSDDWSDESFDAATVDADMAFWDAWDD
ncbi:hypothetical protein RSOLAG1IB_06410 [Rhizoctonia solani AG-1 IB]|uniref:Uncharacterized protein n=1 Tax=Thanatephorus cucumeris (strain AG1-IB / isolate 7/3/14) TaxID=1108050 RepID=A0A0B7F7Q8_THACB|nr:hypothetical protein RSOLAG1IB_06410 [Rhizoctonia solani AG-1 IB]